MPLSLECDVKTEHVYHSAFALHNNVLLGSIFLNLGPVVQSSGYIFTTSPAWDILLALAVVLLPGFQKGRDIKAS
jgi:hypothetical protein